MVACAPGIAPFVTALALTGCSSNEPKPLPLPASDAARREIAEYAAKDRQNYRKYARGSRDGFVSHDCFASDHGRVYCAVAFQGFFYDEDKYCVTGYTATRAGTDVRHVKVGTPDGPGFECGKLSEDGDPFSDTTP